MGVKTTGAEFKRFYNDDSFWPEGAWVDDAIVAVDGVEREDFDSDNIPDAAKIGIKCGTVLMTDTDAEGIAFDTFFRRWKKAQTTRTIVVEVSTEKLDAVIAAIKVAGGKII